MKYTFDGFTIDSDQLCIDYQGKLLQIDSRIIKLMILLIQKYPEVVSQKELLETLWNGSVVSTWSASRLVADARTFFKSHQYDLAIIQTLRGRGYRLAPELAQRLNQPNNSVTPSQPVTTPTPAKNKKVWISTVVMLAIAAISAPIYMTAFHTEANTPRVIKYSEPLEVVGRILWVDDNPSNNEREVTYFETHAFGVYSALTTDDALTLLELYNYDIVISDMGRHDDPLAGMRLLDAMRARGDDTPFVLYTIVANEAQRHLFAEKGGYAVTTNPDTLVETIMNMPLQNSSNRFKDKP
ncbi:response regulator [Pseudidiomarina aestuarii]|uniref:response regulator n=1 Tax=Pseudidiomarina aestuarii TaxID=624146 RepID=UPI001474D63B|nr:response regulator [Pseudidiomarina aestuarii]